MKNNSTPPLSPPRPGKRRWFRFFATCLGVLFSVLTLEICLRILEPRQPLDPKATWDRSPTFFDLPAHQGVSLTPGVEPLRIALIGDSFAQGAAVQEDDRYASRLERLLNTHTNLPPVVVNAHVRAGTSTYQQLELLEEALREKPRLVMLGICLNDTEDWTNPDQLVAWRKRWWPAPPGGLLAPLVRHSRVAALVQRKVADLRMRRGYLRYYEELYRPDYAGWKRFAGALAEFKRRCDEAGCPLVATVFPLLTDDFTEGRYPFARQHEAILAEMDRNGIARLDLLPVFRGKIPLRMTAIPAIDPHPSEIAHRIAAESMLDLVVRNAGLDQSYTPAVNRNSMKWKGLWDQVLERSRAAAPDGGKQDKATRT